MNRATRALRLGPAIAAFILATGCANLDTAPETAPLEEGIKTRLEPAEQRRFLHDYARLLIRLERFDQAEDLLDSLRQHGPGSKETLGLLARVYERQERQELALMARRAIHERRPDDLSAAGRYARTALRCGRYDEAEAIFDGWLEAAAPGSPKAISALNNLGYSALLQGEHGRAVKLLKRALAADPLNRRARANLALAYRLTGDAERANEVWNGRAEDGRQ